MNVKKWLATFFLAAFSLFLIAAIIMVYNPLKIAFLVASAVCFIASVALAVNEEKDDD